MFENTLAITTSSLGLAPSHSLPEKIEAAAANGFSSIEVVYQELTDYGSSSNPRLNIKDAALSIAKLCSSLNVAILALNPFKNFEGHNTPLPERLQLARHWLEVAATLGAEHLQVPSQFDETNSSNDWSRMVDELRQLSDLAASYSIRIAYEAVAWGSYINTWEGSLRMVRDVARPNFGLCLDSFHILARLWGDNTSESGVRNDAETALRESLDRFKQCPLENIFYIQLSDAERYVPPLTPSHRFYQPGFAPGLTWSRNTRPFPLESEYGAYFPVATVAAVWLREMGWKGVVSMEIFDWRMRDESSSPSSHAARGKRSWDRLVEALSSDTQ